MPALEHSHVEGRPPDDWHQGDELCEGGGLPVGGCTPRLQALRPGGLRVLLGEGPDAGRDWGRRYLGRWFDEAPVLSRTARVMLRYVMLSDAEQSVCTRA